MNIVSLGILDCLYRENNPKLIHDGIVTIPFPLLENENSLFLCLLGEAHPRRCAAVLDQPSICSSRKVRSSSSERRRCSQVSRSRRVTVRVRYKNQLLISADDSEEAPVVFISRVQSFNQSTVSCYIVFNDCPSAT